MKWFHLDRTTRPFRRVTVPAAIMQQEKVIAMGNFPLSVAKTLV